MSNVFDGILLIDKPKGLTSHDVVGKVRKILNIKKVGHAGTLDPLATGLMIVLVGRATRLSDYLLNQEKSYEVIVQLGLETDTLDAEGSVTHNYVGEYPDEDTVKNIVNTFKGEFEFPVPDYSAVKVKGKKLYEYARAGIEVPQVKKLMNFESVEFLSYENHQVRAKIKCSKGSFIRTWASELGKKLGVGGHVLGLRRTQSGDFNVVDSLTIEKLAELNFRDGLVFPTLNGVLSLSNAMRHIPQIKLNQFEQKLMLDGQVPERINKGLGFKAPILGLLGVNGDLFAILERSNSDHWKVGCVLGLTNAPKTQ